MKLPKIYEPAQYETDIYALWEKTEAFKPSDKKGRGEPYAIVVPPPNANGNAHLGTAITLYLEDIAARYHRLRGDNVLFLPGADHAGFETQVDYAFKNLTGADLKVKTAFNGPTLPPPEILRGPDRQIVGGDQAPSRSLYERACDSEPTSRMADAQSTFRPSLQAARGPTC